MKAKRLKFKTNPGLDGYPKGKDTKVFVVLEDGTEIPIDGITHASWVCTGRLDHCVGYVTAIGVELEVEAMPHDEALALRERIKDLEAENSRLRERLE